MFAAAFIRLLMFPGAFVPSGVFGIIYGSFPFGVLGAKIRS
jgi:hypothetical protein